MSVQVQGIIRGRRIELEHETGLPTGSLVTVYLEPNPLTMEEKRHWVDSLCGAWAGDSSIPTIFAEIARRRVNAIAREADFDVAS